MHQGENYCEKNKETIQDLFDDNRHLNDLEILSSIVARTIVESMDIIIKIKENKSINEEEYEDKYFEEIDNIISGGK